MGSIATGKHSPYNQALTKALTTMKENGHVTFIKSKHFLKEPDCTPLVKEAKALSIKKMVSLFVTIAIGVAVSSLIFCLELTSFTKKTQEIPEQNKQKIAFQHDKDLDQVLAAVQALGTFLKDRNASALHYTIKEVLQELQKKQPL